MRKTTLLFTVIFLFQAALTIAQSVDDYVLEVRGDTLVVKDDFDMGETNTLYNILLADTEPPEGRVYMLHEYGTYSAVDNPTTATNRKVVIVGENSELLKTSDNTAFPPVICGAVWEGGNNTGGMNIGLELVIKNVDIAVGTSAGDQGWNFFDTSTPGARLTVDNCIMEYTLWVLIRPQTDTKYYVKNSYFVNLSGHSCRRNGGVMDQFGATDSIIVENCTHVMAQGYMYKVRNNNVNRWSFNHNTFINCSGLVFLNLGSQGNASVTNNIFVNTNIQGFTGDINIDPGEADPEGLAMGLINVLPDDNFIAEGGHFYVDKNLVYWDPTFDDYISTLNANAVNEVTDWKDCMVTMNERSQSMFDDDETYPYLTEGTWIKDKQPNFANSADLFTSQLEILKEFSLATVDTTSTASLPFWRLVNDPNEYFVSADWPIPVDLSYDDADLLTAGLGEFPLGDLNWFPEQYQSWLEQRDAEYAAIHEVLYSGVVAVEDEQTMINEYKLEQNYPNPFNPTTVISFKLAKASDVTLKVYNSLGQEVATLVDGFKAAQIYDVSFDASTLSSGIYFYTLSAENFVQSKKMVLMK